MSRLEADRVNVGYSHSTPFNHGATKHLKEARRRIDGDARSKGSKAEQRRAQNEEFVQDWIDRQSELNLSPEQRLKLALKRGKDEDVEFIFDHLDDLGRFGFRVDTFTSPEPASTDDARIA